MAMAKRFSRKKYEKKTEKGGVNFLNDKRDT